jgi:uncharacterized membrane protein
MGICLSFWKKKEEELDVVTIEDIQMAELRQKCYNRYVEIFVEEHDRNNYIFPLGY